MWTTKKSQYLHHSCAIHRSFDPSMHAQYSHRHYILWRQGVRVQRIEYNSMVQRRLRCRRLWLAGVRDFPIRHSKVIKNKKKISYQISGGVNTERINLLYTDQPIKWGLVSKKNSVQRDEYIDFTLMYVFIIVSKTLYFWKKYFSFQHRGLFLLAIWV